MSYNSTLREEIAFAIKTPADPKISGAILQQQLLAMVGAMEEGAVFAGTASPATSPTGEANRFYLATEQGTYTNFLDSSGSAITLSAGEVAFLSTIYQGNNLRFVKISMPQPHIDPTTGNWFVGNVDTGVKAQGDPGTNGHNPNLGTFDIEDVSKAPTTGIQAGDYIVVTDANAVSPRLPKEIYLFINGAWTPTGEAPTATFGSGEAVSNVNIINDPAVGGEHDVASAESVKTLNENKTDKSLILNETLSVNLFNSDDCITGYYIHSADGSKKVPGSDPDTYEISNLIKVKPNHYYYLAGRSEYSGLTALRCVASDRESPLKPYVASTGEEAVGYILQQGSNAVYNGQFKTNPNAEYVQFNVIFHGNGIADDIMLLDVGEVYDASYTPPANYIPYTEPVYKIKESVLPDKFQTIGNVANLTTTDKATLVDAVNEVNRKTDSISEQLVLQEWQSVPVNKSLNNGFYNAVSVGSTKGELSDPGGTNTTNDIQVSEGDTYRVSSLLGGDSGYQIIFWDNTDKCIGLINQGDNQVHSNVVVTAPEGAVLMSLWGKSTDGAPYSVDKLINKNRLDEIESDISDLESSVEELGNDVDEVSDLFSEYQSKNLFDKLSEVDGIIDNSGNFYGVIPSWTYNKCSPLIAVEPNKCYYLSGWSIGQGRTIRCLPSDKSEANKSKVINPVTGEPFSENNFYVNSSGDCYFKTSDTAAYVQFNVATQNVDASDTMMLEYVGDYNPDFVPSEYEDYYDGLKLKKSALPKEVLDDLDEAVTASDNADNAIHRNFKLKVLLVGSSHGMNTIAQFPWIFYNSTNKVDIEVGNIYIGSFSLQRLVGMVERGENVPDNAFKYFKDGQWTIINGKTFAEVFGFTDWDFISLQRSASDGEIWLDTQNEADTAQNGITNINYDAPNEPVIYMSHNDALQYVLNLIQHNVKKNANIIFNSGFATPMWSDIEGQITRIVNGVKDMKAQFGIDFYSTDIAMANARNTYLRHIGKYTNNDYPNRSNNLVYDGQHLDYGIGCYIPGICLAEFICRKIGWDTEFFDGFGSVEQVSTFTSTASVTGNYTIPTLETMVVAKACAKCACDTPDAVSLKLQDRFKWKITQNLPSEVTSSNTKGYSSNADKFVTTFIGTVTSVVVKSRPWDRSQEETTLVQGTDYTYSDNTLTIPSVEGDITIVVS